MYKIKQAGVKCSSKIDRVFQQRNKQQTLKQLHKTLAKQTIKNQFSLLDQKQQLCKKAKTRAKSTLDDYNESDKQKKNFRKSSFPSKTPINILISLDKLSKQNKRDRYESINQLEKVKSNKPKDMRNQSVDSLNYLSIKQNYLKQKKSSMTLKKSYQYNLQKDVKRTDLHQDIASQQQKLSYQRLKHNQERFPKGFTKFKLLGRGGFSLVWLGFHIKTKTSYAVKQILTRNKYQTHLKQLWFCMYFFKNGKIRKQFSRHPGCENLVMMFDYDIEELDAWIIYEICDGSLGSMLYRIYKAESAKQKQYNMKYKGLYMKMKQSTIFLKHLIIQIAKVIDLLSINNIIHSDIKTQNIILKEDQKQECGYKFKLTDYGSSFSSANLKQYTLATPEYMCPQFINYICYLNGEDYDQQMLQVLRDYDNISAIDVWGLGCVVLEIIHGVPLWASNPTKLLYKGKIIKLNGLFSSEKNSKSYNKIFKTQTQLLRDIGKLVNQQNYSQVMIDQQIINVLKGMLQIDPKKRMKPRQITKTLGIQIVCQKFCILDV